MFTVDNTVESQTFVSILYLWKYHFDIYECL